MSAGSRLALFNFESYFLTPVNYDPVSKYLIVIKVKSDPGKMGEVGLARPGINSQ